jgi:hypothetical protein
VLLLGKSDRKPSVIEVDDGVEVLGETVVEVRKGRSGRSTNAFADAMASSGSAA